jgi:hypothetical protein
VAAFRRLKYGEKLGNGKRIVRATRKGMRKQSSTEERAVVPSEDSYFTSERERISDWVVDKEAQDSTAVSARMERDSQRSSKLDLSDLRQPHRNTPARQEIAEAKEESVRARHEVRWKTRARWAGRDF